MAGLTVGVSNRLVLGVLTCAVLCCAESLCRVQVAGLQVVVDQEAIDRAMPLLPATRMTLPLMLHTPQVCCTHTVSFCHRECHRIYVSHLLALLVVPNLCRYSRKTQDLATNLSLSA